MMNNDCACAKPRDGEYKKLNGIILNADNDEYMGGVHIFAKVIHAGVVTDQKGHFSMTVHKYDTLVVTSVGFDRQLIPLAWFKDDPIDIIIRMEMATVELPGITIQGAPNIDYLMRPERQSMSVPGLPPSPPKPDVDVPVGTLKYGILSGMSREAKEKKQLMRIHGEARKYRTYIQTVSSDSVRQVFMHMYDITEKEYNDFIIFFNHQKPMMNIQDPKDIIRVMHDYFLRFKPRR